MVDNSDFKFVEWDFNNIFRFTTKLRSQIYSLIVMFYNPYIFHGKHSVMDHLQYTSRLSITPDRLNLRLEIAQVRFVSNDMNSTLYRSLFPHLLWLWRMRIVCRSLLDLQWDGNISNEYVWI